MQNRARSSGGASVGVLTLVVAVSLLGACSGGDDAGNNSGADAQTATDGSISGEVTGDIGSGDTATTDTGGTDIGGADTDDAGTGDATTADGTDVEDTGPDTAGLDCPGGAGCVCSGNSDCDNGLCIDTPDGKRCAEKCIDTCKNGYSCKQFGDSDVVFVCLPDYLSLCSPCQSKSDCAYQGVEALCLDYGALGHFCGGKCKQDSDCPDENYACVDVLDEDSGSLVKQCKRKPDDTGAPTLCPCTAWSKAAAKKTTCTVTNAIGTCSGTRQCGPNGMSDCSAPTPVEESCNNLDDDCDGQTDVLPASAVCTQSAWLPLGSAATCTTDSDCTVAGESCDPAAKLCHKLIGTCSGKAVCEGGKQVCKDVATPKLESCNGDDDDCDGAIDEDFAWEHPQS
ncbi:MAG: hypothetical protein H6747_13525, partial [Deltaproteobacteria bacterium]|nr:hypothetical protein [Deltaproteobacteria bacterium]